MQGITGTEYCLNTAILFLIFNRPDTTERVFEAIRNARPTRLYVAADGPRKDRNLGIEKVRQAREIATAVDWPCEVKTLFRKENLGCKKAVSEAITWFFENEEQGIILEDDCLPHPDFFNYCEVLLQYYVNDERVSVITGNNFQSGERRGDATYYFSKYNHCWGWATWRRAWKHYRGDLPFWPEWQVSDDWQKKLTDRVERKYWKKIFDSVRAGEIDSWAYPWTASIWFHGGLTATPNVNLVSNIGFGADSTHTASLNSPLAEMATEPLGELQHPTTVARDANADRYVFDDHFGGRWSRFPYSLLRLLRRMANYCYHRPKKFFR
ncbi:MAG: glycosyltransferase family 2 protein [Proteobacteria bacterium]|nr:glycosyltransferase family 2 protein [Pseudomonadota bacterium]